MSFTKYTVMLTSIALFVIALIAFAMNFAEDNNASINIADDGYSSVKSGMESDAVTFYTNVNTSSSEYMKSTISSQTEASEGGTQFKVTPGTSLSMVKRALTTAWEKIFGSDSEFGVVLTALIAIFGFVLFMFAWKAWAGRSP